jgi:type 1 glutamine amidotransferase
MAGRALIVHGGWWGHSPAEIAEIFRKLLVEESFKVEVSDSLDAFLDLERLKSFDLIIPHWTMGQGATIDEEGIPHDTQQVTNIVEAVASGVGLAGCHGGMCDTFHTSWRWNFMTGGKYVDHPGKTKVGEPGTLFEVNIKKGSSPIVEGIEDFTILTEQYYMLVDPVNEVLATTRFPGAEGPYVSNGSVDMPVFWTRRWGKGRVFYGSLGHEPKVFADVPAILTIMRRGFLWACKG